MEKIVEKIVEKEYLISVIVPIYNVENYVRKCIESILDQVYRNLQVILVDNDSTDNSGKICDEYALKDQRVCVIHQPYNMGLVCSIKAGMEIADGQFIGIVYGDDYIDENMYKRLLYELIRTDSDFSVSGSVDEIEGGGQDYRFGYKKGIYELSDANRYSIMHKHFFEPYTNGEKEDSVLTISTNLFHADFFKENYMEVPDNAFADEDSLCLIVCMLRAHRFVMVGETYYHHVQRKGSIMHHVDIMAIANRYAAYRAMGQILQKYDCYKEFIEEATSAYRRYEESRLLMILRNDFNFVKWQFPGIDDLLNKRIVIWGAGDIGRAYYAQICKYEQCDIVAWIDSAYDKYQYDYCKVQGKDAINKVQYDVVVIGVRTEKVADAIKEVLMQNGVESKKIIWKRPEAKRIRYLEELLD